MWGSHVYPLFRHTITTASLSHHTHTCSYSHWCPQPRPLQAPLFGSSPNHKPVSHLSCSQWGFHHAPHPMLPDASLNTSILVSPSWGTAIIDTPFQATKNEYHHSKSDRMAAFSLSYMVMFLCCDCHNLNTLLRNVLPGWTTLQACFSLPASDCSSCLQA